MGNPGKVVSNSGSIGYVNNTMDNPTTTEFSNLQETIQRVPEEEELKP
jgi:hypothetical protein